MFQVKLCEQRPEATCRNVDTERRRRTNAKTSTIVVATMTAAPAPLALLQGRNPPPTLLRVGRAPPTLRGLPALRVGRGAKATIVMVVTVMEVEGNRRMSTLSSAFGSRSRQRCHGQKLARRCATCKVQWPALAFSVCLGARVVLNYLGPMFHLHLPLWLQWVFRNHAHELGEGSRWRCCSC